MLSHDSPKKGEAQETLWNNWLGDQQFGDQTYFWYRLPSGKQPHSYWKWWFIVDLPIEHGDFPYFFVCLPEGKHNWMVYGLDLPHYQIEDDRRIDSPPTAMP